RKQTASASAPAAAAASRARSTLAGSSGASTAPSAERRSMTSKRCLRSTTGLRRTNVGTKSAGMLRLVRPISIRSRKPAVVRIATRAPRRSSTALVPTVVPWTSRRTSRPAMPSALSPDSTAALSSRGLDGPLVTTTRPVVSSTAVRSVKVPPTSIPTMNMTRDDSIGPRTGGRPMAATSGDAIRHLWTHKTQDHPWLPDEELVIERAEGVWVRTERGKKLLDGFAGLAVVNVGHGRREIAEAIAEQTVRLAYYPTTRQFSNRPAAELATKLAALTPGDLEYSFFAVSGAEANERSMQIARQYWLAKGQSGKYKVISFLGAYHGATAGTYAICGLPHMVEAYKVLHVPGFAKVAPPHPYRGRGTGTDEELIQRRAAELREAILREDPETVSAVILEP